MTKTLIITNDFPPRPGGIQAFVHNLVLRRPAGSVVVYAPDWRGAAEFDAEQPFPTPKPLRQYDALELTLNRRFSKNWLAART